MKKTKEIFVCSLENNTSLETLSKEIDYAKRFANSYNSQIKASDIKLFIDAARRLIAVFEYPEPAIDEKQRMHKKWVTSKIKDAIEKHQNELIINCDGSMEKVSTAASVIMDYNYSNSHCMLIGKPIFDDSGEFQLGINVTIHYR